MASSSSASTYSHPHMPVEIPARETGAKMSLNEVDSQSAHRHPVPTATPEHSGWWGSIPVAAQGLLTRLTSSSKPDDAAQLETENRRLRERLAHLQATHDRDTRAFHQESTNRGWELRDLQVAHESVKELLEARSRELTIAQQFLSTADPVAEADVIRMVKVLNNDVMQAASLFAENLAQSARLRADAEFEEREEARHPVAGIDIAVQILLYDSRRADDPFLALQIATQAYLVSSCMHIICAWHPDDACDKVFGALYREMRQKLAPPVARKWRALTKSNLSGLFFRRDGTGATSQSDELATGLTTLLKIAGYSEESLHDSIAMSRTDLTSITESALKLRSTISEELSSCDLEVFSSHPGTPFDPESMEDNYGHDNRSNRDDVATGVVLCTTEMGVKRSEFREAEGIVEVVLLKPKIALESIRDDALGSACEANPGSAS